jgi:ribosomal protein L7/L12
MTVNIRSVSNGFIVEYNSYEYVAKTLTEAASLCGEATGSNGRAEYAPGMSADVLASVKRLARDGYKIDAIKKLRSCFVPVLGLREAKEMVEILCG